MGSRSLARSVSSKICRKFETSTTRGESVRRYHNHHATDLKGKILDSLARVGTTWPALRLTHQNPMCRLHPEIALRLARWLVGAKQFALDNISAKPCHVATSRPRSS